MYITKQFGLSKVTINLSHFKVYQETLTHKCYQSLSTLALLSLNGMCFPNDNRLGYGLAYIFEFTKDKLVKITSDYLRLSTFTFLEVEY